MISDCGAEAGDKVEMTHPQNLTFLRCVDYTAAFGNN